MKRIILDQRGTLLWNFTAVNHVASSIPDPCGRNEPVVKSDSGNIGVPVAISIRAKAEDFI